MTEVLDQIGPKQVLFVGMGRSAVCWYRAALPAMYLGADWVGVGDNLEYATGICKNDSREPNYDEYAIIIWQQPRSSAARAKIKELRAKGKIVLLDVDDYLHGVRRMKDHDFTGEKAFSVKQMREWERTMSLSDGIICSTQWLADKYSKFAPRTWVCMNGLDLGRYDKSRTMFRGVNIGWAGATGHIMAFEPVLNAVVNIMRRHDFVNFVSVGQPFADVLPAKFGIPENRIFAVPFCSIEAYPNAMSLFSVALAPARDSGWYRAKSALRYYEAAAIGVPTIGQDWLYPEIIDGKTGFKVTDPSEWEDHLEFMVNNHVPRFEMGVHSRNEAWTKFDMAVRCKQWEDVFVEVAQDL